MDILDDELLAKEKIAEIENAEEILNAKIEDDESNKRFDSKSGINYHLVDDETSINAETILKTDDITDRFKNL